MNYQDIYNFDLANGEGVRVSLFVSGCTLHCKNCFNKEAWDFKAGKELTSEKYFQIYKLLESPNYSGLSILGGEPFDQEDYYLLMELCQTAHFYGKNVWIWSGHTFEEINLDAKMSTLLQKCDVLVDGRFDEKQKDPSLNWRGSRNQRVIDVQESLKQQKVVEYVGQFN